MILRLLLIHHSLQLIRTFAEQHNGDRCEEDFQVEEQRLVFDVVAIQEHHLAETLTPTLLTIRCMTK